MIRPNAYFKFGILLCGYLLLMMEQPAMGQAAERKPNIILIFADDLGFGEVGCYGQQQIQTPNIDQLALNGMAFTNFYAGATVCAPSRCTLMTGRHNGHASVRGNAGRDDNSIQSLQDNDYTIAECLKEQGYQTACIGKWGLGEVDQPGHPLRQGFDHFFGYLNQHHAHNYYPTYLYNDMDPVPLQNEVVFADPQSGDLGGGYGSKRIDYSHELFMNEAIGFMTRPREEPFFLYLSLTLPHANNEAKRMTGNGADVPDWSQYANMPWDQAGKQHAAMVTLLDEGVGRIVEQLKRLGIQDDTLLVFTSDNGPHDESGHDLAQFQPSGPLRGIKRSMYEGGIRVPMIACWPNKIAPNTIADHVGYAGDFFATFAQVAGTEADPVKGPIDSISILPTLLANPDEPQTTRQQDHEYLYFEFYEQGSRQAVRFGDWKAVREPMLDGDVELYNLADDLGETKNIADQRPEKIMQAIKYLDEAHVPNPNWKISSKAGTKSNLPARQKEVDKSKPN